MYMYQQYGEDLVRVGGGEGEEEEGEGEGESSGEGEAIEKHLCDIDGIIQALQVRVGGERELLVQYTCMYMYNVVYTCTCTLNKI